MPSEADVIFAQLLATHHLVTERDIKDGLAALARILEYGVLVNLAEVMVARGSIDNAKASEIARVQLRKTHVGLLHTHLATLRLTREEDRRIGNIAAHNNLVTQEQLDEALRIQGELRKEKLEKPLGVIMVDKAYLAPEVVESLLELQSLLKAQVHADPKKPTLLAHEDLTFCAIAVADRRITPDQAQQAIATQRQAWEKLRLRQPIPEVIYGLKLMDPEAIRAVGEKVLAKRQGASLPELHVLDLGEEAESRLGQLLLDRGLVAENQLQSCLDAQRRLRAMGLDRKLGEVLLIMGFVSRQELLGAMDEQSTRRASLTKLRRSPPPKREGDPEAIPENALSPAEDGEHAGGADGDAEPPPSETLPWVRSTPATAGSAQKCAEAGEKAERLGASVAAPDTRRKLRRDADPAGDDRERESSRAPGASPAPDPRPKLRRDAGAEDGPEPLGAGGAPAPEPDPVPAGAESGPNTRRRSRAPRFPPTLGFLLALYGLFVAGSVVQSVTLSRVGDDEILAMVRRAAPADLSPDEVERRLAENREAIIKESRSGLGTESRKLLLASGIWIGLGVGLALRQRMAYWIAGALMVLLIAMYAARLPGADPLLAKGYVMLLVLLVLQLVLLALPPTRAYFPAKRS